MIRLGIVGYGNRIPAMDRYFFREEAPEMRVVGLVDPDEKGAAERLSEIQEEKATFYPSLGDMVKKAKLDGLVIGTRCHLHAPYAIEAAKYDIPLFMEKPVAITMKQAVGLEKAFSKSKCEVVVSFPLRVSSMVAKAKEYIQNGAVGEPVHITGLNYKNGTCYWKKPNAYETMNGLFLQKATHDLDYMMHLMGSPITRVAALTVMGKVFGGKKRAGLICSKCKEIETCPESPVFRKKLQDPRAGKDHRCLFSKDQGSPEKGMNEDCSSALLEFASGAQGVYTQVFFSRKDEARFRGSIVSGYDGTLKFDFRKGSLEVVRHHETFNATETTSAAGSHFGGDAILTENFFNVIKGKEKSKTTIQDGLRSVYACLAAKESSEKGRFVKVRQVQW